MNKLELVRTYEPVLHFSRDSQSHEENFFPLAVEHYVSASHLCRRGEGVVAKGPELATLGTMAPLASREYYLAYAAGELLTHAPSFQERLRHGGLALFTVEGEVIPHLIVTSNESFSFAVEDAGLKAQELAAGAGDPGAISFSGGGQEAAAASFRITDLPRLPTTIRDVALERYAPYLDFGAYPPVYYYHVTPNRGYLVIQYWFFYAYNDWGTSHGGVNDHEGDWEALFIFLQNDKPAYVAFSAHNGPPQLLAWDNPTLERVDGTHPIVRVGAGSHACYATADVHQFAGGVADHHRGDGPVAFGPGTSVSWREPLDLAMAPWALYFAGGWGALVKRWGASWMAPGAQAPTGPVWHYGQWESPVNWARIPH